MTRARTTVCGMLLFLFATRVSAVPLKIDWDPSVSGGSYVITGPRDRPPADLPKGPQTQDFHADLPDGDYRLSGSGFDFSLQIRNNGVHFKHGLPASLQFDRATHTLSFNTATIELDLNGYLLPVVLRGVTEVLDPSHGPYTLKVHCGQQKLLYNGGTLTIDLDAKGNINLPDNPGGFALQNRRIVLQPRKYTAEPGEGIKGITLRSRAGTVPLTNEILLLPSVEGYVLGVPGLGKVFPEFHIDALGNLSTRKEGPFSPLIEVKTPDGKPIVILSAPGGKEYIQRQAAADAVAVRLHEQLSKETAVWQKEFVLTDAMRLYSFPEELVSYAVQFPAGKVLSDRLAVVEISDQKARYLPLQLADIKEADGFLQQATVRFRASLPAGTTRVYRLVMMENPSTLAPEPLKPKRISEWQAKLVTDRLSLLVPAGRQEFPEGKPLSEMAAPLLAMERSGGDASLIVSRFTAPAGLKVLRVVTTVRETGPLMLAYSIRYDFGAGRSYEVLLTVMNGDDYVLIEESIAGFRPEDEAYWQVDFTGVNPTRRQAMSNGGYDQFSGPFDKGVNPTGQLPIELGLNVPNSLGVMRSAAFWDETSPDGLLLSLNRLRDWKTAERHVWNSRGPGNLTFHQQGKRKFFQTRLQGQKRFWALASIPRELIVNRPLLPGKGTGAGPEVRLWQKLGDLSLNAWKDRVVDWDEKLDPACFADLPPTSYEEWMKLHGPDAPFPFLKAIFDYHWDYSSAAGAVSFRGMPNWFGRYARSRADWTPEQRRQVRAILLMMAYSADDDNNIPHLSMLGGHPNFVMDHKMTIAIACATFPNHPDARKWRDSFLSFFNEWITTYQRSDKPEVNAFGGRWTENLVCYSGQSLSGVLHSHHALMAYDGTDLINTVPRMRDWVRWHRDILMSPHDGVRLAPPEGAHARSFEQSDGGHQHFRDVFFTVASILGKSQPELAAHMKWIQTNGKEGIKPALRSTLLVDHGLVLRHDFGGPNESYLHLQNIAGRLNYRWTGAGTLYYGAKGKVWSYNLAEDNGDEFTQDRISGFSVRGKGLKPSPTDQLLYDFDFVQFYRSPGEEPYKSRSVMMVRDEYLAIADEVNADTEGQFVWANTFEQPQIYQLKPGAVATEYSATESPPREGQPPARTVTCRKYVGKGDFLTIVAPAAVDAKAQPFGATVNDQHLFWSAEPLDVRDGKLRFQGTSGYAAAGQLALFQGTLVARDGFELHRTGGDFGVSAAWSKATITGRFVGRSGGQITLSLPEGTTHAIVHIGNITIPSVIQDNKLLFQVEVAQKEGIKSFTVTLK